MSMKNKRSFTSILLSMIFIIGAFGSAQAYTIDFEGDTTGNKLNPWESNDSNLVSFSDSNGNNLNVQNYGHQSDGKALAVYYDDASYLQMNFVSDMDYLALDFGNDDAGWSNPGDQAVLTLFDDGAQVGQVNLDMNRNDYMDQRIIFSGLAFDYATFIYDVTTGVGLIEIVDNIEFYDAAPVPEPSTIFLLGSGLVGLAFWRRRQA